MNWLKWFQINDLKENPMKNWQKGKVLWVSFESNEGVLFDNETGQPFELSENATKQFKRIVNNEVQYKLDSNDIVIDIKL